MMQLGNNFMTKLDLLLCQETVEMEMNVLKSS